MTGRTNEARSLSSGARGTRSRRFKDYLRVAFIGAAMGSADVIPGVSGGTMAFILGIYDELLGSIRAFDLEWIKLVFCLRLREAWRHVNGPFLISLGIGLGGALVTFARVIVWLFDHHPTFLFAFFFGLILASIISIGRKIIWNLGLSVVALAGALAALGVVRLTPLQMPHDPLTVFVCSALAIMAMILPGISGAFLLLLLGQYRYLLDALNRRDVVALLPAAAGMGIGLLSFSRLLHWFLQRHRTPAIAFLTGFLVGSLWKIWPFRKVVDRLVVEGKTVPVREALQWPGLGSLLFWGAVGVGLAGFLLFQWFECLAKAAEGSAEAGEGKQ